MHGAQDLRKARVIVADIILDGSLKLFSCVLGAKLVNSLIV